MYVRACVCVSCTYMLLRVCDIACDCTKNKSKERYKNQSTASVERYCSKIRRGCQIDSERVVIRARQECIRKLLSRPRFER